MLRITIVTVCYNAEETIEKTINSVISQDYGDVEYLIIDGESTDGTLKIIDQYKSISYIHVMSGKDSGLYNAMNKGISIATGDYVLFLNSGDYFCDDRVLSDILPELRADIVYGNVIRRKYEGDILEKYYGKNRVMWLLLQGRMISHQVMFTKTEIMRKYGFDESFRITADYNFLVKAKKDKCSMHYVDRNISVVENMEGLSSRISNLNSMREEDDRSLRQCFPVWYWILKPIKFVVRKINT